MTFRTSPSPRPLPWIALLPLLVGCLLTTAGATAQDVSRKSSRAGTPAPEAAANEVTLATQDPSGTVREVDGITCDNLSGDTGPSANSLLVRCPLFADATRIDATLTNPDGTTVDLRNVSNTGRLAEDAARRPLLTGGALTYYPPAEFNRVQNPQSAAELTLEATRPVLLSLLVAKLDGSSVRLPATRILLARPPVALVHGINTPPAAWQPFTQAIAGTGAGSLRVRMPFVTVNHFDLQQGNAPVEAGAARLESVLAQTLSAVRQGQALTDAATGFAFRDYVGLRLASRKADVVAWSYGGAITRWYLASEGSNASWGWYRQPVSGAKPTSRYRNDIRKVLTLGTMWRGVPLANYVNEVLFPPAPKVPRLADAPVPVDGGQTVTLGQAIPLLPIPTRVPSMEVMAVNGPWMSHLIFGATAPGQTRVAAPFVEEVAYGSVAGDNNRYPIRISGSPTPRFDIYTTVDDVQQPSWFPYFALEQKTNSLRNYSDGVVPVWTAAIPGSYQIASVIHSAYPQDPTTQAYVARWLNNSALPRGSALNEIWNDERRSGVQTPGRSQPWTFPRSQMAPATQEDLYQRVQGVGRINPLALREIVTLRVANITPTTATLTWLTATATDSTVSVNLGKGKKRNFGSTALTRLHSVTLTGLRAGASYTTTPTSKVPVESGGGRRGQAMILRAPSGTFKIKTLAKKPSYITLEPVGSNPAQRQLTVRVAAYGAVSNLKVTGSEFTIGGYTMVGTTPPVVAKLANGAQQVFVLTYRDAPAVQDIPSLYAQISCEYRNSKRQRKSAKSVWMPVK